MTIRRSWSLPAAFLALVLAVLLVLTAELIAGPSAAASPITPPNPTDTVRALAAANARAEAATEASLGAQEQLKTRQAEVDRTRRDSAAAKGRADAARADRDRAFVGVDQLTRAAYQGGDLDQLSALLDSDSPQGYLDKVSLLDSVSTQNQAHVQRFLDATAAAEAAEQDVATRAVAAGRALEDADRTARDAVSRKGAADRDVAVATAALRTARPADVAALRGPSMGRLAPGSIAGAGIALEALRAALTQQGKPYVWGATGISTYDCSGLIWWAYRQIGIGMPRTAAQQSQVGTPINAPDAMPGDLVFFGSPATHVGIYVGNGLMLNAPQSGDVVKVARLQSNLSAIRRIGG